MSDPGELLARLRAEIKAATSTHDDNAASLNRLADDIQQHLEPGLENPDSERLTEEIELAITRFEAEHPRATVILNEVMIALNNMGI